MRVARAAGLALGIAADRVFADPERFHPVAGFGRLVRKLERRIYRNDRATGVSFLLASIVPVGLLGCLAQRATRKYPLAEVIVTGTATWIALCGTTVRRAATDIAAPLAAGDAASARTAYPRLFFTTGELISDDELPAVTIFAVSECSCDAEFAPLFWAALAGVPGALGYRAINTLDNMVGYRSERYLNFGWASARLDDLANYVPARIAAAVTAACAAMVGASPGSALRVWRRDAATDSSPNSGRLFAAYAGALEVSLVKPARGNKPGTARVGFGSGPPPDGRDALKAIRLSSAAALVAAAGAIALAGLLPGSGFHLLEASRRSSDRAVGE